MPVAAVGFRVGGVFVESWGAAARRVAAHAPGFGQACPDSVRWSRQYVCLQDSQRNGRKSSWLQYS